MIAFVSSVAETVGEEGRYLHLGLTSSDVIDTGFAAQLCEAADLLHADLDALLQVLETLARTHQDTVMIGRTHGVHAKPITFGMKAAHWYAEMSRSRERLLQAKKEIAFGKISGAVGTFANIDPEVEAFVCSRLGLAPEPISTQVVPRDRHAAYFSTLAVVAELALSGSLPKYAICNGPKSSKSKSRSRQDKRGLQQCPINVTRGN